MRRLLALGVSLCLLGVAGCGGKAGANPVHTPAPRHPTATPTPTPGVPPPTVTSIPAPTGTPTATPAASPSATPRSVPTTHPVSQEPRLTSAAVSPTSVASGGPLQMAVRISGNAGRVELYLSSGPGGSGPLTYTLAQTSSGIWTTSGAAPSVAAQYHFSVGVYDAAGRRTVASSDAWNVRVTGGVQSGPRPLPGDIPLAPPFSYGNPEIAVFDAESKTVNGSEVVSNTRSDVSASVVAQYYVIHLPRAGWTIDPSTIPGAGVTSFTLVATSGANRVCAIQFSGGAVHIFYGSFSA